VAICSRTFERSLEGHLFELIEGLYFGELGCPLDAVFEVDPHVMDLPALVVARCACAVVTNERLSFVADTEPGTYDEFFALVLVRVLKDITETNRFGASGEPR
jgi:hypothetical protein